MCYDSSKESKYITYLDANKIEFKWLNQKETNGFCLNSIEENSSIGHIPEAHLEHPDSLYKLHNDYPLAPEKLEISQNMLLKYCCNIADEYEIKIGGVNKLVPNLGCSSL